jgi:hypothetical protein
MFENLLPLIIAIIFDVFWYCRYNRIIKNALKFQDMRDSFILYGFNVIAIVFTIIDFTIE